LARPHRQQRLRAVERLDLAHMGIFGSSRVGKRFKADAAPLVVSKV
jgi:hypothetical protein